MKEKFFLWFLGCLLLLFIGSLKLNGATKETQVKVDKSLAGEFKGAYFFPYTSSIFGIMGVAPSVINTPGLVRDFKVDWVIQGMNISKNISLEADLIWMSVFRFVNYDTYYKIPYIVRRLGDTTFSLGNYQPDNSPNGKLGIAFKIPIYRQWLPSEDKKLQIHATNEFAEAEKEIFKNYVRSDNEKEREKLLDMMRNIEEAESITIKQTLNALMATNWNTAYIDIGYGCIFNYYLANNDYATFSNMSAEHAVWAMGGFGIGKVTCVNLLSQYKVVAQDFVVSSL